MTSFTYTGTDKTGGPVTNTVEAENRFAVYEVARTAGHTVSGIEEVTVGGFGGFNMEAINRKLSRVKGDELIMVTRNLGSMITAGLTVTRALSVIERQSKNPKLKGIMQDVTARINQGDQFFETLRPYPKVFNNLYVAMIKAGEESGNLAESLGTLAIQMERSNNLKKKIKGAMMYPAIVITIMGIIGILMMIFVMPQITSVFANMGTELPATTQLLITVSDFFANYTLYAIAGIIGFLVAIVYAIQSKPGQIAVGWLITRVPVIGTMAKETNAARTARTLSSLLNSGVDVIQSISITEEVLQNKFYKDILRHAAARVQEGEPLSTTFVERSDLYPILVGEMILVGEETGQIAGMLGELAIFYETEVERKTKDLSTIIEPLLMVVIGSAVGFFALALIAPIYSIGDSI
jgi:type IV pilus assembly protein PilC